MNDFEQLSWRVRHEDLRAAAQMQQELETRMIPIVRRTLQHGTADSPLAQRILAEAKRVLPAGMPLPAEERDRRIAGIARRVSTSAVNKLRPQAVAAPAHGETVLA